MLENGCRTPVGWFMPRCLHKPPFWVLSDEDDGESRLGGGRNDNLEVVQ